MQSNAGSSNYIKELQCVNGNQWVKPPFSTLTVVRRGECPGAPGLGPGVHTEACKAKGGKGGMGAWAPEWLFVSEFRTGKKEVELEDEEKNEAGGPCEKLLMSSQISPSSLRTSSLEVFQRVGGRKRIKTKETQESVLRIGEPRLKNPQTSNGIHLSCRTVHKLRGCIKTPKSLMSAH